MNALFADTYYLLAVLNKNDPRHAKAAEISRQSARLIITSARVLTEVADALSASHKPSSFVALLGRLRGTPAWTIAPPDEESFDARVRLYAKRSTRIGL